MLARAVEEAGVPEGNPKGTHVSKRAAIDLPTNFWKKSLENQPIKLALYNICHSNSSVKNIKYHPLEFYYL